MGWWVGVGALVQLYGAYLTLTGLFKVWYANTSEPFTPRPQPGWLRRAAGSLRRRLGRLWTLVHMAGKEAESKSSGDTVTGTESESVDEFPPFPKWMSLRGKVKWLHGHLGAAAAGADARFRIVQNEQKSLREAIDQSASHLQVLAKRAATAGLRRQAVGLLLITLGALLTVIPTVWTAFAEDSSRGDRQCPSRLMVTTTASR